MTNYKQQLLSATPAWVVSKLKSISETEDDFLILLEDFCERAGIMEFDGIQSRFIAEKQALECILNNYRRRNK